MIQKCPNCGQWCETDKQGAFQRAKSSWEETVVNDYEVGEKLAGKIGLKKLGGATGGGFGFYRGILNGVVEGLLGSKYKFICPTCEFEWEVDDESDDQTSQYNHEMKMCALMAPKAVKEFISTKSQEELEKIVKKWQHALDNEQDDGFRASACDALAFYNFKVNNNINAALDYLSKSESLVKDASIRVTRAMMSNAQSHPLAEYDRLCSLVSFYDTNQNLFFELSEIEKAIDNTYDNYVQQFMNLPPHKREVIIIVDSFSALTGGVMDANIKVLLANNMPKSIKFLDGRFMLNTPYVCHPYKPDRYLRYENHEDLLFQDEMRDLQRFLGLLGAKHITITRSDSVKKDFAAQNEMDIKANAKKGHLSASGNMHRSASDSLRESLTKTLNIGSEMEQGEKPEMPTEFNGWAQQASWQDFAESRFTTKLKSHVLEISTSEARAIDTNRQLKVEAEISALIGKVNGGVEITTAHASSSSIDQSFVLNVEFYPLSSYDKVEEPKIIPQPQIEESKLEVEETPQQKENKSLLKKVLDFFN